MEIKGYIEVDIQKCKGCQLCATVCPKAVIGYSDKTNDKGYYYAIMVNEDCIGCGNCAIVCPDSVITAYRAAKK
ncbi:MAG: 4Fe-4S dicluster domain-containing protein [Candidatus Delongbacteria bacterium]|nr:4Fe-4S dicluster domain-containing protein [Candidatus Delongbacteria bacterium]